MPAFLTTITLQQALENDYIVLNNEMTRASFRLRKDLRGTASERRVAEYNSKKNSTMKEVADAVYRAVKKTGLAYSFTIVKQKTR